MTLNQISEQLLLQVKKGVATNELESILRQITLERLLADLPTELHRKAFWINIYNAYFQLLRQRNIKRPAIFSSKLIHFAETSFSLDDIEHGILRRFRLKWSLGYLINPLAPGHIIRLAVHRIDYRIHFALNCGAVSCPPIAFYNPNSLEQQLDMATASFLESETKVSSDKREIWLTALMKWFLADFGGFKGIRRILKKHLQLDAGGMRLRFRPYNWKESLDNFA